MIHLNLSDDVSGPSEEQADITAATEAAEWAQAYLALHGGGGHLGRPKERLQPVCATTSELNPTFLQEATRGGE